MASYKDYHLRCELRGHAEDVRAVLANGKDLVTASRDKTLILWSEDHTSSGMGAYKQAATLVGHSNYVTAVCWLPPSLHPRYPGGALVSGSRDNSVVLWNVESGSPSQILEGHNYQVTAVAVAEGGSIVSSSLDKTIRVWDLVSGAPVVLEGHEGPVLCCIVLSSGEILSGSGDTTIRRWSSNRCTATIKAHVDSVRGLCELPGIGFVSASHDQTLKVWTFQAELLAELVGHQALVYSVSVVGQSMIASASEDRTCKIWTADGSCLQTIEHPSCVWDVTALPSGDVLTACGDSQAYVWSTSDERTAPDELAVAFQASLPSAKGGGSEATGQLPLGLTMEPPDALLQPGRPGQTKVIGEGGVGMAYTWNASTGGWEKIGQVVGDPGAEDSNMAVGNKFHNGQQWDYVFDVDVADGSPPLKMALNAGENPYEVADRFLLQHDLPISYKDQIVQFILQNTGSDVSLPEAGFNPDPFTGAGAYVPGSNRPPATGAPSAVGPVTGGGVDPFTGGSSMPAPSLVHCPAKIHLLWGAKLSNPAAIRGRIIDLSSALGPDMSGSALTLPEVSEGGALDALMGHAAAFDFEKAASNSPFTGNDLQLLAKMLTWPTEALYPALDLTRLLSLTRQGESALAATAGDVQIREGSSLGAAVGRALDSTKASAASQQTCLKLLSNCCSQPHLKKWLIAQAPAILDAAASCISSPKPAVQLAHATMAMNYSLLVRNEMGDAPARLELKTQLLSGIMETLISGQGDELLFRALVAAGTLLHGDRQLQSMADDLGLMDVVHSVPSKATQAKVGEAAKEVQAIVASKM